MPRRGASNCSFHAEQSQKLGLTPGTAKSWLPFRSYALQTHANWPEPKPYRLTVFYLVSDPKQPAFWFPVNQYYARVAGLDTDKVSRALRDLGFVPTGKWRDYRLNLRGKNNAEFFDVLFELVTQIEAELRATL